MAKRLGLDLGSNSLGWALVDSESSEVLAAGVRIFPEGVDRDKQGGEVSKNEARRVARLMRRQITRRARRKLQLRRLLIKAGLLPPCAGLAAGDGARIAWQRESFAQADPYALRAAVLGRPLEPYELGRALMHLGQRRGFLSNRRADKAAKKETSEMLQEISALEAQIQSSGSATLGQYLADLVKEDPRVRLRGRHTRRDMYEREFEAIWESQSPHHPTILTAELHEALRKTIFYQRPLRIPKSMVGLCELIANRRRCPRADRRAQRFRMLNEVNNLLLIDEWGEERALNAQEREALLVYLAETDKRKFDDIRKKLGFSNNVKFNLERGDRKSLWGMPTDKALSHKAIFGKNWAALDEEAKNTIVRSLLDDNEEAVKRKALEQWGLAADQAEALLDVDLPSGYMSFCREAIAKLLPHLEEGLPLLAGDKERCAITAAGYLRPDQRPVNRAERLPNPPDLPNPIVRQALFEVRRVVNAIIGEYGTPDQIHVELAREVKGSARQRAEYTKRIRERERRRSEAADRIRECGCKVSRDAIDRYLLWDEQGRICIYSGQAISIKQLLAGEVDVDHILPRSRSLDDSLMNKVVCFRQPNAEKGNRTPYEWLGTAAPTRYEQICLRAREHLPYGKYRKILQKEVKLDDFINRQLTDTAYISRAVIEYLRCLVADPFKDILCTKGQLTAELRHDWGLNTVLRNDGVNLKLREDHRHHAIDAIVIAFTDRARLQLLSRGQASQPPREHFHKEVSDLIGGLHVSHRARRKVAGALHEETIYGPTDQPGRFSYRKPLTALSLAEVAQIRDATVRAKVEARLAEFNISAGRKKRSAVAEGQEAASSNIPAEVWAKPLWMNQEKRIPILKVRLTKPEGTIRPIRGDSAYVKPGSTHHLCLFELPNGKRDAVFVTMIDAARRAKAGQPVIQRQHPQIPDAMFLMSLSKGESVLVDCKGDETLLLFDTAASTSGQMWFVNPMDARPSALRNKDRFSCRPRTLNARKVTIDPLGRLRWAHD